MTVLHLNIRRKFRFCKTKNSNKFSFQIKSKVKEDSKVREGIIVNKQEELKVFEWSRIECLMRNLMPVQMKMISRKTLNELWRNTAIN